MIATIRFLPTLHLSSDSFTDFQFEVIKVQNDPTIVDEPAKPVWAFAIGVVEMILDEIGAVCLALDSERITVEVSDDQCVCIQSPYWHVLFFWGL